MLLFGFAKFLPNGKVENNAFVFHSKTDSVTLSLFCLWEFIAFGVQKLRTIKKAMPFLWLFHNQFTTGFAKNWIARSDCVGQSVICCLCSFKLLNINTSAKLLKIS